MHDRLTRARLMSQPIERYGVITGMIETAENLARDYGITREQSDAYAVRSQQRAAAAWREGRFAEEIVPVAVPQQRGAPVLSERDVGFRGGATMATFGGVQTLEGERKKAVRG